MPLDDNRGKRIRMAMAYRNKSKTHALAAELNVSVAAISRWQNGGHLSLDSACRLARVLDVSLDWLLLGRGTLEWRQDERVTAEELSSITSLRRHPPRVKSLLVELIDSLGHDA